MKASKSIPAPPEVVLFDLDGTLSNSAPGILAALRHAFAAHGIPPLDLATERALLGPPFYESLPPLIGGSERLPAVLASYRLHYGGGNTTGAAARGSMYDTTPYEGVPLVVAAARAAGIRLAVATSKPEPHAVPIVAHLGLASHFETVGGDEFDGSLPTKSLVIDKVLTRLGHPDPATVVMVGDRIHDITGAREHGIASVGVRWGYAPAGELEAADPDVIVETPAELAALLGLAG